MTSINSFVKPKTPLLGQVSYPSIGSVKYLEDTFKGSFSSAPSKEIVKWFPSKPTKAIKLEKLDAFIASMLFLSIHNAMH